MEAKARMKAILEHYKLSANEFAAMAKVRTGQAIYDLLSGKTKTISRAMENKILSCCPEISRTWLLTGEGQMLKSPIVQTSSGDNSPNINGNHVNTSELLGKALDEIAELRKINQEQVHNNQAQFDRFMTIIEHLTNKD